MEEVAVDIDEAFDLLDTLVSVRYPGYDAIEFLTLWSDGLADAKFPDSSDLQQLAALIDAEA